MSTIINISTLKQYKTSFSNQMNNFNSSSLTTYQNSYITSTSDTYISKMNNVLNKLYDKINNTYKEIDKWWTDYNDNAEGIEKLLENNTTSGNLFGPIMSTISSLPKLDDLKSQKQFRLNVNNNAINLQNASSITKETPSSNYTNNFVINSFNNLPKEQQTKLLNNIMMANKVGTTISNGAISLVEGLGMFGEALTKTASISIATQETSKAMLQDAIKLVFLAVSSASTAAKTSQSYKSILSSKLYSTKSDTLRLWSDTKAFVGKDYVKTAFDKMYENTSFGQNIKNNAIAFEPVRDVTNGIGYIGGTIALSVLTLGAYDLAAGATIGTTASTSVLSAASGGASISLTGNAVASGAIAFTAGIGKNTSTAWKNGANTISGLTYGTVMGAWEGLEMTLGQVINSAKVVASTGIGSQLLNSASHVVLDGIDGASAGFTDPLFQMIYNPTDTNRQEILNYINFDSSGNKISDKTWEQLSLTEKYLALFKNAGGLGNVLTKGISASAVSALSEVGDVLKSIRASKYNSNLNEVGLKTLADPEQFSALEKESPLATGTQKQAKRTSKLNVISQYPASGSEALRQKQIYSDRHYSKGEWIDMLLKKENDDRISFYDELAKMGTLPYGGGNQGTFFNHFRYEYQGQIYDPISMSEIMNDAINAKQPLPHFQIQIDDTIQECVKKLVKKGFSKDDALAIITSIDARGACTYASLCEEIFTKYRHNPLLFYHTFGYPMYRSINGEKALNGEELLLDLFIFINTDKNGGNLIKSIKGQSIWDPTKYEINQSIFFDEIIKEAQTKSISPKSYSFLGVDPQKFDQQYLVKKNGRMDSVINRFLKSKNLNLNYKTMNVFAVNTTLTDAETPKSSIFELETGLKQDDELFSIEKIQKLNDWITKSISRGNSINLGIGEQYYNKFTTLINLESFQTGEKIPMRVAHSIELIGITGNNLDDGGYIISTWGEKYIIRFRDLLNGAPALFIETAFNIE